MSAIPFSEQEGRRGPIARSFRRFVRGFRWHAKSMLGLPRTLLVELNWRLGDECMALPLFPLIRERFPRERIVVQTNWPGLFERNPHVDAINPSFVRPDRHILLRGAPRDQFRLSHYARRAALPQPDDCTGPVYWNLAEYDAGDEVFNTGGPVIAVAQGASWETKRWPVPKWKELCARLLNDGYEVIELGLPGEAIGAGVDFTGERPLPEVGALLAQCQMLVCCDSGLMHVALALGLPVLALYGPTEPKMYVRNETQFHVITNERECRGCWNVSQAMTDPGICPLRIHPCMGTIEVDEVLARIESLAPVSA